MTPSHVTQIQDSQQRTGRSWLLVLAFGLLAGLALRLFLAASTHTPGQWDAAFYYTVAKNIVLGRGLVIDYIWHYINSPTPLTHYSSDFWHPLTSYLMALPMSTLGISPFNAILASIIAGLGMALVSYALGKAFGLSPDARVMATVLAFFAPYSIQASVTTDSIIFFGLASITMLYWLTKAQKDSRYFLLAALASGLGHLTRQDGILLLATILTCILLAPIPVKRKLTFSIGVVGIHLAILSPLLIKNYQEMGFLLPPGPPTTRYLTEHDDVYAYGKAFTFQTYLQVFGWDGILNNKLQTAVFHIQQAYAVLNPGFVVLAIISLVNAIFLQKNRQRLLFFLPALIYGTYTYAFYILIASFALFSAQKSLVTLIPFLSILIMDFSVQRLRYRPLLIGLFLGLTFYLGVQGYVRAAWANTHFDSTYTSMKATQPLILEDARQRGQGPSSIIVMTHDPWHYYEATGWPTLMIPNNDLDTILSVATSYHATYLILPAPRPALDSIYNGNIDDPRLEYLGIVDEQKIYRLHLDPD
ncbi:MAG: glycosyltransferase family 39 protein [Anaerolineales bacterium]|nr:glycosyltransferase family 39 protein [Anaerolineales bacterium]